MCPAGVDRDNFTVTSRQSQSIFVIRTNRFLLLQKITDFMSLIRDVTKYSV